MRLFVAIDMDAPVQDALERLQENLPFGRPVPPEQLHLTLAFLGEQDTAMAEAAHEALEAIRFPAFEIRPKGLGAFGADVVWAGLDDPAPAAALNAKVMAALRGVGLVLERRRYRPHVTLARFPQPDAERLAKFLAAQEAFPCPPFTAESFVLYRSTLTKSGVAYDELARYPLQGAGR